MWSNSTRPYSLRDLFHMSSSVKRHKLDPPQERRERRRLRSHHRRYAPEFAQPYYDTQPAQSYYEPSTHYDRHPTSQLSSMPPEIHLSIFDTLDPVSSTCPGLTNKKFYPMHRRAHRNNVGVSSDEPEVLLSSPLSS